jgi:glycosyltransferase involved in cell wall biosynthesis
MMQLPRGMNYVVVAKEGDPVVRPARARLIWAANTAQATASLGLQCLLAGGIDAFTYRIENVAGKFSAYRAISALYGVEGQFELALLHRNSKASGWTADGDFARYVLPNAGVVHTRDPQIALVCAKHNIAYILENHDEDYQKEFTRWDELKLGSPLCLAIVAITEAVKQQLIELGMPEQKIVVLDSGVNQTTALRRPRQAALWRKALLVDGYRTLAVYTGGMQAERGIEAVIRSASQMPDCLFVLAGGHSGDLNACRSMIMRMGVSNIRLIGYQNHETVCELQQAADVAIFSRAPDGRPGMTSPLKIFEYLLSGAPLVAATIPATADMQSRELAAEFYRPDEEDGLTNAIRSVTQKFPYVDGGYQQNVDAGLAYTWQERQRRLLEFVGDIRVKVTF